MATAADTPVIAAVDWGGTWIRSAAVVGGSVVSRSRRRRPSTLTDQYEAVAEMVGAVRKTDGDPADAVGVGIAGVIQRGIVGTAANLGFTDGTDVAARLQERISAPVFLVNDSQALALGLATRWSAGLSVVLTIGTGIGGAVVQDGTLLTGQGAAGDVGHIVVAYDGQLCTCGGRGCLEQLVSGRVLARTAAMLARTGASPFLGDRAAGGRVLHAGDLQDAAAAGDRAAATALDAAATAMGAGLRTVLAAYDPDRIVLAGAALAGSTYLGAAVVRQWDDVRPSWARTTLIHVADDEDAALRGAAAFAEWRRTGD